ncbi:MAG: glycosyltransferase 87 family protein [Candidatus Hodarchaeota archaeon]
MSINDNDYLSFYYAGLNIFKDLPNLYNSLLSPFPFRYLPISAYFFTPFSLLGLEIGYLIFQISNFFLNILIIYLIYKIIHIYWKLRNGSNFQYELNHFKDIFKKTENESILHQNAVLLIMTPQFMNYFLGQINLLVLIFVLSSLFYFLKGGVRNDLLGGLLLGLGVSIRPTLIFILPFLMRLHYNRETKKITFNFKTTVLRLLGTMIIIFISGVYFLIYPQMLIDFIDVNLAGKYTYAIEGGLEINPSFSLTRIILIFLQLIGVSINGFLIFIIISLVILVPIYFLHIQNSMKPTNLFNGYFAGILVTLIVYFDSWPHHLVVLTPFLIFFLLLHKEFKYRKLMKYSHYLLAILVVIFWGIFYLTYEFFPFNIGSLILMMLLYYSLVIFYVNQVE